MSRDPRRWFCGLWRSLGLWRRSSGSEPLGQRGEAAAARFLETRGYRVLERQLRGRYGELDLVAVDGDVVVFVEVKSRTTLASGHPTEAITPAKQRKVTQSALAYLKRRGWLERRARIDVIAVLWPDSAAKPQIDHYVNAFDSTGFGQMFS
jgi:putative endonuclease